MRNKYPGFCYRCGLWVAAGQGHFEKVPNTAHSWRTQHADCAIRYRGTDKMENPIVTIKRAQIRNPGIDTTVKSAQGIWRALAPTWEIVMGHKRGEISDAEYTVAYEAILNEAPDSVYEALYKAGLNTGIVTVLCYCQDGKFCHTYQLIDYVCQVWPNKFRKG